MYEVKRLKLPVGKARGKALAAKIIFLMLGIVAGVLFQPISSEASSLKSTIQYEDGIPDDIRFYCEDVGEQFDICPELLEAIAYNESRFIPTVSNGKHYGLMQVNVNVHAKRIEAYGYTPDEMFEAYPNLVVAADYLAELFETYGDENPIVLSIYSGNWKAVEKYKEYGFISSYVDDILTRSAEYERLHGK